MSHRSSPSPLVLPLAFALVACDEKPTSAPPQPPTPSADAEASASKAPATPAEAAKFVSDVDRDLRRLWTQRDRALWINQNFITHDTEELGAAGEKETAAYMTRAIQAAARFDHLEGLPPEVSRQLRLLRLAQLVPAPADDAEGEELAKLQVAMTSFYGKGKYCAPTGSALAKAAPTYLKPHKKDAAVRRPGTRPCYELRISRVLAKSRSYDELTEAGSGVARRRARHPRQVRALRGAGKLGAKAIGF